MRKGHECNQFCKVHWYWSFHRQMRLPYPVQGIHCGPPAYHPKKPTPVQAKQMSMVCPHTQVDLTCNFCLRHMFHLLEI